MNEAADNTCWPNNQKNTIFIINTLGDKNNGEHFDNKKV
jgi:hypothetical protein